MKAECVCRQLVRTHILLYASRRRGQLLADSEQAGPHLTVLRLHAVGQVDQQGQALGRRPPEEVVHAGLDAGALGGLLLQHGPHQVAPDGLRDQAVQVQLALHRTEAAIMGATGNRGWDGACDGGKRA